MTQEQMILEYLKKHGSITPLDALKECGCMRLGARIYDLRSMGYNISTVMRSGVNSKGGRASWAEYQLRR